ncbi:transposase [Streptomyces canus]|uniref:transposase n=1 Tax=Streptomyces canus TaxID=58343 RepID=UPI0027898A8B|nr:transposase [Streptomyces canus]MDQ0604895.1 transposase [Streptomyces canus]
MSEGIDVFEVIGPGSPGRRRRRRSDRIDAQAAALAVLSGHAGARAKTQLTAVLVIADPELREQLADLDRRSLIRACALLDDETTGDPLLRAARLTLRLLAQRIEHLTEQIRGAAAAESVERTALPAAARRGRDRPGQRSRSAFTMGDNPGRLHSEASFAALCGASPVEYSSGRTPRHRLNRGGDRQANAALFRIVRSRLRFDPRTQAYYERRMEEGKTRREIIRCLKRYVVREVYDLVQDQHRHPVRA